MSPLQKIAQEMDQIEEERRDRVTPLSPVSTRASLSSASSYGRRNKNRNRDRLMPSSSSDGDSDGTRFSDHSSIRSGNESISIRSTSSSSSKYHQSSLRQEMLRSPEEIRMMKNMDLFPYTKARLSEVKFKAPQYEDKTTNGLRRGMLSTVFGWDLDIEDLIRDEQCRHKPGSASSVLLSKWLGEFGADTLSQMIGSETMSSSDWMLLALSSQMGTEKHIGEAFVKRLLKTDELHPAVCIFLGLGQQNDAVEAYVSRKYYMEAVLLTCLLFPNDWQRQSYLVRKWGEVAVAEQQTELALRCFSCTSVESSEMWFSPRAQNEVYAAQQQQSSATSPPISPPSAGASSRLKEKNASLKLITNFGEKAAIKPHHTAQTGITPIVDSAVSPGGLETSKRPGSRGLRDPSSARTATPGGWRKRTPSNGLSARDTDATVTPMADEYGVHSRPGSRNTAPNTAIKPHKTTSEGIPSPAPLAFNNSREASRNTSRDRNPHGLQIRMVSTAERDDTNSPQPNSGSTHGRHRRSQSSLTSSSLRQEDNISLSTDGSLKSFKGRNIDRYINSLEEANHHARQNREKSRTRTESSEGRSHSRPRQDSREGRSNVTFIKPSKRSPSSPSAMTTEDARKYSSRDSDADYHKDVTSPVDSRSGRQRARSRGGERSQRSKSGRRTRSPEASERYEQSRPQPSRTASNTLDESRDLRGRGHHRVNSGARSPSSPSPMDAYDPASQSYSSSGRDDASSRHRQRSSSRKASDGRREHSAGRRQHQAQPTSAEPKSAHVDRSPYTFNDDEPIPRSLSSNAALRPGYLSKKELAAKELEERRLSLARRPSAPSIPHPGELNSNGRPNISPRAVTDSTTLNHGTYTRERSYTADLDERRNPQKMGGTSTSSVPIGLPATPRAMKHPRYMGAAPDEHDYVPEVPQVPQNFQREAAAASNARQQEPGPDTLAPLLPSSVFGQKDSTLPRSASAPPEHPMPAPTVGLPARPRLGSKSSHSRKSSHAEVRNSGSSEEKHSEDNVIIVEEPEEAPPMLPELQHLAVPPPPPPPPAAPGAGNTSSGVINIGIDDGSRTNTPLETSLPPLMTSFSPNNTMNNPHSASAGHPISATATSPHPGHTTSPLSHRRGRGSMDASASSISSKLRGVRDRMRSESRGRNVKSPPSASAEPPPQNMPSAYAASPYETVIPQTQFESMTQAANGAMPERYSPPRYSPPRSGSVGNANASGGGGGHIGGNGAYGYRNPREIRAAMSPTQLQPGVYNPTPPAPPAVEGGMI